MTLFSSLPSVELLQAKLCLASWQKDTNDGGMFSVLKANQEMAPVSLFWCAQDISELPLPMTVDRGTA